MTTQKQTRKKPIQRMGLQLDKGVSLRMRQEHFDKLQRKAFDEGMTITQKLREMIARELAEEMATQ